MAFPTDSGKAPRGGFTLVELMVVLAIIALLLTIALPRFFSGYERAKEATLRQDLSVMRDAIDKYYGDKGVYPPSLQELVTARYLREIPVDPVTSSADTWIASPPPDTKLTGVYDIHSGAPGTGAEGKPYGEY
jgi:general secretion pathway protein G